MRIRDVIHDDRYPDSYYHASMLDDGPFLRLEGNVQVDVCIIGGGFSGVSAALELAKKGVSVGLLEQNRIGWGASGRNGGQVIGGYGPELSDLDKIADVFGRAHADAAWDMGVECTEIIKNNVRDHNIDCDLKWGYFDAAMTRSELADLKNNHEALISKGYPFKQVLATSVDEAAPYVSSPRYIGGLYNEGWGHVQPLNLVRGEARAAAALGAKIFEDARVSSVQYGPEIIVDTGYGRVTCDQLVYACNAYLGDLQPKLASRIIPAGSYIIATEPLSEAVVSDIMAGDCAVCDQRWALDYFRLSADKRLLFGGLANYSGRHPTSIQKALVPKMLKVFPSLKNVKIDYEWGGYLGIGLNRIPQLGKLDENVYFAQAYSGHGVAQTHMSGRLISEAITGNTDRFNIIANVSHPPFPGGKLLRQPLLAAGMMFYKLRDELGL